MQYRSGDGFYNGFYQTVRVENNRSLTGQTASDPRVIASLPFSVTDNMALFDDTYSPVCPQTTGNSPPAVSTAAATQGLLTCWHEHNFQLSFHLCFPPATLHFFH